MNLSHVQLPADEVRCRPGPPCHLKGACARFLAPIQAMGAKVGDFTHSIAPSLRCVYLIDLDVAQQMMRQAPAQRAHEPIRGLS